MRSITIARNNMGISREQFRRVLMDTILRVDMAYYDLIFARENLDVKRQSRELARDQARITQIRIDVGASAPLDILQPEVAIATREEEVIVAEAQVRDAEDRLRALMNLPADQWDRPIVPTTDLDAELVEIDSQAAVAQAYLLRPEILQAGLDTQNSKIDYRYFRNQVLPRLDFDVDYGAGGIGGTQIIRDDNGDIIRTIPGGYGDAFDQVAGIDFPSWTVGFNFGVPIRNIGARADAKRAEYQVERQLQSEEQLRQNIAVEVRQAARNVERFAKQIVAARAAREAAERNLGAERKRFDNGMTTNFEVLQVQQDLSDSRSREIAAVVAYNQAVSSYHDAIGDLLDYKNIEVDVPGSGSGDVCELEGCALVELRVLGRLRSRSRALGPEIGYDVLREGPAGPSRRVRRPYRLRLSSKSSTEGGARRCFEVRPDSGGESWNIQSIQKVRCRSLRPTPGSSGQPEGPANPFSRLFGVLISPGETFESIARRPDWLVPLLIWIAISIGATMILVPRLDYEPMYKAMLEKRSQMSEKQRDEQLDRMMESAEAGRKWALYTPVASVPLMFLVVAVAHVGRPACVRCREHLPAVVLSHDLRVHASIDQGNHLHGDRDDADHD